MGPKYNDGVGKRNDREIDPEAHGEGDEKMRVETGFRKLPASEVQACGRPPGAWRGDMDQFSLRASGRSRPCQQLDFRP